MQKMGHVKTRVLVVLGAAAAGFLLTVCACSTAQTGQMELQGPATGSVAEVLAQLGG
jgi:translation initiation factor 1 (eIF-1/SUI1)